MWAPTEVLIEPEVEALQMVSDSLGKKAVRYVYIDRQVKNDIMHNAILAAICVDEILSRYYFYREG